MPDIADILMSLKTLPKSIFDFINKYFPLLFVALIALSVAFAIGAGGMYILIWAGIDFNSAKIFFKACVTLSQVYMLGLCIHNDGKSELKTFDVYLQIAIFITCFCWRL